MKTRGHSNSLRAIVLCTEKKKKLYIIKSMQMNEGWRKREISCPITPAGQVGRGGSIRDSNRQAFSLRMRDSNFQQGESVAPRPAPVSF